MLQYTISQTITAATQTELLLTGAKRITLRDNTTYDFHIHVNVSSAAGKSVFNIVGACYRVSGAASVVLINALHLTPGMESGSARDLSILADTTNGALGLYATGAGVWKVVVDLYPNPEYTDYSSDYQSYIDEIAFMIHDDDAKLSADNIDSVLQKAITDWGKDEPLIIKKKIAGDGTGSYLLATILSTLYVWGHTKVIGIEYPVGEKPAEILDKDAYELYDDGTAQDGSNIVLRLLNTTVPIGSYFITEFMLEPAFTSSVAKNFPDTRQNFSKVTTLASAYACQRLATAYAQSIDGTISADVVNYNDKSAKYTSLAKEYFKRYNHLVFGENEPTSLVKAAMVHKDIEPISKTNDSGLSPNFLFHGQS